MGLAEGAINAKELRSCRVALTVFIIGLIASGLTAFPLLFELNVLSGLLDVSQAADPAVYTGLRFWIATVRLGLENSYGSYPWIAYGTDWLAFAHIVIAVFFIGPLVDPVRNRWVLIAGLAACLLVVPFALFAGACRGIPVYWRLIDCSFGVLGAIPLLYCLRLTRNVQ
jgi:hypothetical protein